MLPDSSGLFREFCSAPDPWWRGDVGLRGAPLRVEGRRRRVQDLPAAGRHRPQERLPRHQEPPLQGISTVPALSIGLGVDLIAALTVMSDPGQPRCSLNAAASNMYIWLWNGLNPWCGGRLHISESFFCFSGFSDCACGFVLVNYS